MNEQTTIQLEMETKQRLEELKEYPRETYDDVVVKLVQVAEQLEKEPELRDEILKEIAETRREIEAGKFLTTDQLLKELNLNEV